MVSFVEDLIVYAGNKTCHLSSKKRARGEEKEGAGEERSEGEPETRERLPGRNREKVNTKIK